MKYIIYIYSVLLLIGSCNPAQKVGVQTKEFSALYNPSEYSLNIDYQIYHISDELTSLYIRLFPGQLLFSQANEDAEYRAVVQITYAIFELDEIGKIIAKVDSASYSIKLNSEQQQQSAYFSSKILQIPTGKKYLIRLDSRDMQRGTYGLKHLYIDKENEWSSQNFSVISSTGFPRFLNYFKTGEVFRIDHRLPGRDSLYLDFFRTDNLIPRPPVDLTSRSYYPRKPDTTMVFPYTDNMMFTLPEEGMFFFRLNPAYEDGLTLLNFGPDYPQVKSEKALLEPLFYLATMTEFTKLLQAKNKKRAVDEFWIQRSNSLDRSRELIRVYYNRVLYSNLYFTADREGWMTDRGMVFVLFGPPDRMKDSGNEERWFYISNKQGKVIEFVFERQLNRYSNQDLIWKKNTQAMQYWSAAVSSWRSGKVYSLGK